MCVTNPLNYLMLTLALQTSLLTGCSFSLFHIIGNFGLRTFHKRISSCFFAQSSTVFMQPKFLPSPHYLQVNSYLFLALIFFLFFS